MLLVVKLTPSVHTPGHSTLLLLSLLVKVLVLVLTLLLLLLHLTGRRCRARSSACAASSSLPTGKPPLGRILPLALPRPVMLPAAVGQFWVHSVLSNSAASSTVVGVVLRDTPTLIEVRWAVGRR